jgi:hypothetical protein
MIASSSSPWTSPDASSPAPSRRGGRCASSPRDRCGACVIARLNRFPTPICRREYAQIKNPDGIFRLTPQLTAALLPFGNGQGAFRLPAADEPSSGPARQTTESSQWKVPP